MGEGELKLRVKVKQRIGKSSALELQLKLQLRSFLCGCFFVSSFNSDGWQKGSANASLKGFALDNRFAFAFH
jgi:hypothetical protein